MKSVLISIQPYWVFLIIAQKMGWKIGKEKTVEVRKNCPKDENWDKGAKIYCTKDKKSFARIPKEYQPLMEKFLDKVIGEFVCDEIDRLAHCGTCNNDIRLRIEKNLYYKELDYSYLNKCQLSYADIDEYSKGGDVYGWHISNLVIYDEPRELREFCKVGVCPCDAKSILHCTENMSFCAKRNLIIAPQSWCYVESEAITNEQI